eukprot:scaffold12353_cov119-Isochrysis_galbana.AAC.3
MRCRRGRKNRPHLQAPPLQEAQVQRAHMVQGRGEAVASSGARPDRGRSGRHQPPEAASSEPGRAPIVAWLASQCRAWRASARDEDVLFRGPNVCVHAGTLSS